MQLIPTEETIKKLLEKTHAVKYGHYELPNGIHTNIFFQLPQALRYFDNVRKLGVALSRKFRLIPSVRAELPHISIVSIASGGIPIAFSIREALDADEVVWAEKAQGDLFFRPLAEPTEKSKCILVDDILLTSRTLQTLIERLKPYHVDILAIGVLVDAGIVKPDFGDVPFVSLIRYDTKAYQSKDMCELCKKGQTYEFVKF